MENVILAPQTVFNAMAILVSHASMDTLLTPTMYASSCANFPVWDALTTNLQSALSVKLGLISQEQHAF